MRILVVFTGGTIGSTRKQNTIDVSRTAADELLARYKREYGGCADFEVRYPCRLLSENCTPKTWELISHMLSALDYTRYDGILIAHGTDTLSYTSALLGLLYGHVPVPMVLISSNYPLEDARSNGYDNFKNAVSFVRSGAVKGVFTIDCSKPGENLVYLSTRLVESEPYADQYSSFGGRVLGRMRGEDFSYEACPQNPSLSELNREKEPELAGPVSFDREVMLLRPYPGLSYRAIDLGTKPAAVLHYMYHSATACVEGENTSMLGFLERCANENIKVYAASFKKREDCYATSRAILDAGAVPLFNISAEAAYVKLAIAYNQREMKPEEYMAKNLFYESVLP